jgi:hypothetical protein
MMRAKMEVQGVAKPYGEGTEVLTMSAVCGTETFGPNGESEDNTFARWTPSGNLSLTITNPNLLGKFTRGQKFYVDFTEVPANPEA